MQRNKRSRIKDTRPRPYHAPFQSPDGKIFLKGLPVPHIPDEREDFNTATPEDIANHMKNQLDKHDELRKDDKLTPEWRDFGERHGKE